MTFLDREQSNYGGEPVLLYEFHRGSAVRYYSSGDTDIEAGGKLYVSTPLSAGPMAQKGTAVTDVFELITPDFIDPVQWFAGSPPSDTVYVVVRRFHYGDAQSVIMWIGQVVSIDHKANDSVTISAQAVSVTLKRGGLRLSWQRGCPHGLYDQNCRADKTAHAHPTTISAVGSGSVQTNPNVAGDSGDIYWNGGTIEWDTTDGVHESRLIESCDGSNFVIFGYTDGLTVGLNVNIYPGCKRTSQWCDTFFRNIENYGGFPWMPTRTPYDGDPVF